MGRPKKRTTSTPSKNTEVQKIKAKEDNTIIYKCPTCGKEYRSLTSNFPSSQSELYAGWDYRLPICKSCLTSLFNHYLTVYDNEDMAIRRICEKYDIYYHEKLVEACQKTSKNSSHILSYISKANLYQFKGKTYDTTLDEERSTVISSIEDYDEKKTKGEVTTSKSALKRWGIGVFEDSDYAILDEHYKTLKDNNPNADNNQEIFIKSLCHLNLLMMKALKNNDLDGYTKANGEYTKTFKQAGLKTVKEKDSSNDDTLGVTLAAISQYTPEEFYKDKSLYKDWSKIGDYYERHIRRPIANLITGNEEKDYEYFVPEVGGEDDA